MDWSEIDRLIAEKYIYVERHPSADLAIYNYTCRAQYDNIWTPETKACRGLIVDGERNIVARPFEKFFNIDQHDKLPDEPFEVFEKLDGSLGILYWHDGAPNIATRGSFVGPQAEEATAILRNRYGGIRFDPDLTYLFEIIYPSNRIVVDYGDRRDLVLLTVIETATGRELLPDLGMPTVRRLPGADIATLQAMNPANQEGVVIRFQSGLRVKLKFAEYKRLHRLLTGVNERHLWEAIKSSGLDEFLERVPDEFYAWVKETEAAIRQEFTSIEQLCQREFKDLGDRKQTAEYFKTSCTYPSILFAMLDGRPYDETVWKLVRPKTSRTFKVDTDG